MADTRTQAAGYLTEICGLAALGGNTEASDRALHRLDALIDEATRSMGQRMRRASPYFGKQLFDRLDDLVADGRVHYSPEARVCVASLTDFDSGKPVAMAFPDVGPRDIALAFEDTEATRAITLAEALARPSIEVTGNHRRDLACVVFENPNSFVSDGALLAKVEEYAKTRAEMREKVIEGRCSQEAADRAVDAVYGSDFWHGGTPSLDAVRRLDAVMGMLGLSNDIDANGDLLEVVYGRDSSTDLSAQSKLDSFRVPTQEERFARAKSGFATMYGGDAASAFAHRMNEVYSALHDGLEYAIGDEYSAAVDAFDEFVCEYPDFCAVVIDARGDYISSDREAAAFMLTYAERMGTEPIKEVSWEPRALAALAYDKGESGITLADATKESREAASELAGDRTAREPSRDAR